MTRLESLVQNPKRTLGVLAGVLVAVGLAIGSGANFTAQSANPSNTFTAGTLTMDNSKAGAAILTATNMKPGDVTTGTVDITNTGSVDGDFVLTRSALTDTPSSPAMSAKLDLVVTDCGDPDTPDCAGGTEEYNGTLGAMSGSTDLETYSAAEAHRYEFEVTFNSSADNTYQSGSSTATFQWNAS